MKHKIALIVSHPIQHFCPQYASFAKNKEVDFKVFFASKIGLEKYFDPNFKKEIAWGDLYLDQFEHVFLNGDSALPSNKNIDAPALDNVLTEFKPDIIVIYGYFQKLQRRAYTWALRNKTKLAYISDSELRQKRNLFRQIIKYLTLRNYFSRIDFFLSVGDANEEFYRYYGVKSERIIRMHFPINIAQFDAKYAEAKNLRDAIRSNYGIQEHEIALSTVGKLVAWKNHVDIIQAMKTLELEEVYCHLFILGSGNRLPFLVQEASQLKKSKVHFVGFVNPEELPSYYAATDIYVHPASVEPHSIAISEAIYMGLPVIVSNRSGSYGLNDDVQENKNGIVYELGDSKLLAKSIKKLIKDTLLRQKFSAYSIKISRQFQQRSHYTVIKELKSSLITDSK